MDDDEDTLHLLSIRISSEGFDVDTATNGEEALNKIMMSRPDVVVTDLKMPGIDGMTLLQDLQLQTPTLPVIMITAHGTIPDAVSATKMGAFAFITKPVDKDELVEHLTNAARQSGSATTIDAEIISQSTTIMDVMEKARRAAASRIPVLLLGESGTGKEMMAKFIHQSGEREGSFIAVNCGAIPESLMESELFGYEAGAFTGAEKAREGLIRAADHGTLFLDEIGDMPAAIQAKLLRTLQENKVRPLGSKVEHDIDIQVVSATHRHLDAMVSSGDFREDLYYRLNVVQLSLPPLRERPEDIPLLAQHFAAQVSVAGERKILSPDAMEVLVSQRWPGNIRQLYNIIQRCAAMAASTVISATLVRDALGDHEAHIPSFNEARDEFTRQYLVQLLKVTGGNVSRAARLADRNRTDFHKLLKKHGIDSAEFKENG